MKFQTKITLLFFAISAAGLILLNAAIFYFVSQFSFKDFFDRLEARVNLTAQTNLFTDRNTDAYKEVRARYLEKLEDEKNYVVKIDSNEDNFPHPLKLPQSFYKSILDNGSAKYNESNHFYFGKTFEAKGARYMVIVAASDPYGFKELTQLKKILIVCFLISIVLSYIAGIVLSHYTMKPIQDITISVKQIKANNLHSRLPEVKGNDVVSSLISTFNTMLTRLETAFETQNNFISNASHELRTPLTIMTSEAELLLSGRKLDPVSEASVKTILAEAEKLHHILTSLLGLAQSGFDGKKQNWQQIRVDELVMNVADAVKKIDADCTIDIDFSTLPEEESQLYTAGNNNLLLLALSNIVMNGCKYSKKQPVKVQAKTENGFIVIVVTDNGIGIPEKDQQHVFEPFFRASNTSEFEGFGIGLPLTLNIIRLHKGSIGISSQEDKGTEIQVYLPISVG
ncbi:two-component sensor histidine kinase [Pedobacter quisquiliarum]|uniref:histidine kinase n=1 Tax=Pedobacter quisquiliarum TaxID=1834438 RepID=A0A916XDV1_9SPHI|nr:HAMP domain-containing sensor histidine kinase [Pedobacter quisquiliarum]GGC63275.1 two-component sensor histidine kinase [Pedobacter quisquiliarum]